MLTIHKENNTTFFSYEVSKGTTLLYWSVTSLINDLKNIYGIDLTQYLFNPLNNN